MDIGRYQNLYLHLRRSVAEHAFSVALIAQSLAMWETMKFHHKVDMADVLERAINHDLIELATGDILSKTKKRTPEMRSAVDKVEEIIYREEIERDIPKSWREKFRKLILTPKDRTIEGKIITAADAIDVVYECAQEIKLKNEEDFVRIMQHALHALTEIDLDSVRYWLKWALQDIGLEPQHIGDHIQKFIEGIEFPDSVYMD